MMESRTRAVFMLGAAVGGLAAVGWSYLTKYRKPKVCRCCVAGGG